MSAPVDTAPLVTFEAPVEDIAGHDVVRLPAEASAALPSRGQVAMAGAVDGRSIEVVVEPDGRRGHWIKLADVRPRITPAAAGATLTVSLAPADAWPEPEVPDDLHAALDDAPDTAELWDDITPMARWEWVRWVRATRSDATRAKRVGVTVSKLRDGKRRPCCFDLAACTDPELARSGKLIDG